MEVLKDDAVMNAVCDLLLEEYESDSLTDVFSFNSDGRISPSDIRSCLAISSVTDTSAVKVVATTKSAEISAAICNDLTKVAPKYVSEAVGVGSINTIDKAKIYDKPVSPNKTRNTIIGMGLAFILVSAVVFLLDFYDNTIKDADAVGKKYKKAIIGEVQQFEEGKQKKGKNQKSSGARGLLTNANVPFNVVESYKSIRTNILFTIATSEKKIIAVSSPNPGEGKSTSAANLAIALAQTDSSVLLIDADMRKPVQHKTFKVKNAEGLSTLIIMKSTVSNSIRSNVISNLDLLPAGPIPPNPSELLASEQFKKLLDVLSSNYDYIIIDTPPINVVSDAMVMKDSISGAFCLYEADRPRSGKYAGLRYERCPPQPPFVLLQLQVQIQIQVQGLRLRKLRLRLRLRTQTERKGRQSRKGKRNSQLTVFRQNMILSEQQDMLLLFVEDPQGAFENRQSRYGKN